MTIHSQFKPCKIEKENKLANKMHPENVNLLGRPVLHSYYTFENTSYIANVAESKTIFLTNDPYSLHWFYPRYEDEALHEPVIDYHKGTDT